VEDEVIMDVWSKRVLGGLFEMLNTSGVIALWYVRGSFYDNAMLAC
jgi:hypothetical protein